MGASEIEPLGYWFSASSEKRKTERGIDNSVGWEVYMKDTKIAKDDLNGTKQHQNSVILCRGIQRKFNILKYDFYNLLLLLNRKFANISIFVYLESRMNIVGIQTRFLPETWFVFYL